MTRRWRRRWKWAGFTSAVAICLVWLWSGRYGTWIRRSSATSAEMLALVYGRIIVAYRWEGALVPRLEFISPQRVGRGGCGCHGSGSCPVWWRSVSRSGFHLSCSPCPPPGSGTAIVGARPAPARAAGTTFPVLPPASAPSAAGSRCVRGGSMDPPRRDPAPRSVQFQSCRPVPKRVRKGRWRSGPPSPEPRAVAGRRTEELPSPAYHNGLPLTLIAKFPSLNWQSSISPFVH
jgi:hypothetical protein